MRRSTVVVLAMSLLCCCHGGHDEPSAGASGTTAAAGGGAEDPADSGQDTAQQTQRKIVRTGELALAVDDLAVARTSVLAAMRAAGGHVAQDQVQDGGNTLQRVLCLRVPNAAFEPLVASVERLGRVERLYVVADDVTTQWIDLDARLRAKRQMEARFLELFARAASIEQVIHVERELGTVRAEIEAMESKLRATNDRVALSTLTVTLSAPRSVTAAVLAPELTQALATGWSALLRCVVVVLTGWPLLLLATLAVVGRRMRRLRAAVAPAAS